jgi:tRNA/rRNA methyltransferase
VSDSTASPLGSVRVVLVEPMYEGNVGATARVCANFGVDDLVIVEGPELTDRANMMAVHADELLAKADTVDSIDEALAGTHHSIAFTARTANEGQDHRRDALALPRAAEKARKMNGTVALVFGREDDGLTVTELEDVDLVTRIPVDESYPSMNLSHAVGVGLYEACTRGTWKPFRPASASREELEILFNAVEHLARTSDVREHKIDLIVGCLRRVLGRTRLSTWEYHRLMGLISRALKKLEAWPLPGRDR